MKSEQEKTNKKGFSGAGVALGLGLGMLVGVSAAIILTPMSGRETRSLVKEKAEDVNLVVKQMTADRAKVYKEAWKKGLQDPHFRLASS